MINVLITGGNGQLGSEIRTLVSGFDQFNFIFTDIENLDICNKKELEAFIDSNQIDSILNCAAYTAVDRAENDMDKCFDINEAGVRNIGEIAYGKGIHVIHISTDYVFDGKNYTPYTEDDPVNPTSIYGKSKLAGEVALRKVCPNSIIIRTSWLYSAFGNNFVKTMIRLGQEKESLSVVFDQVGTPTYAADLANVVLEILDKKEFIAGTYHYSNEGVCSWFDFARKIHQIANIQCVINPIESKEYSSLVCRPFYSVLNKTKIKNTFKIGIPHWEESLAKCIKRLL